MPGTKRSGWKGNLMDFVTLIAPVLGISFLIERILESVFNVVELSPNVTAMKRSPDPAVAARYATIKQVTSMIIAILIGIVTANVLGVAFLSRFGDVVQVDPAVDRLITGAVAGAISPYAHQILEALLNFQKLLEAQKKAIERGEPTGPIPEK
jgi:hypothetical protein